MIKESKFNRVDTFDENESKELERYLDIIEKSTDLITFFRENDQSGEESKIEGIKRDILQKIWHSGDFTQSSLVKYLTKLLLNSSETVERMKRILSIGLNTELISTPTDTVMD